MSTRRRSEGAQVGTPPARFVVAALCFGGLVSSLTQTLVLPIQGELPRLLSADAADTAWVVTITLLVGAVTMPAVGRASDVWGRRPVLLVTAAALLFGSVVVATGHGLPQVLVGRALQGVAMGYIPVGISTMKAVTPPELTTGAIAALSATLGVGGALGLPLAAWVVQLHSWQVLFWMSAGAALAMLTLTFLVIPDLQDRRPGRFDGVGAVGLAVGLSAVLVAVSKGNEWGWTAGPTLVSGALGVLVLIGWSLHELRRADPLVDLRAMTHPRLLGVNVAAVFTGFGMMGSAVLVPQLLQLPVSTGHGMGQSLVQAGLWMAPGGLMMMLAAPVASRLIRWQGARRTLVLGGLVMTLGYLSAVVLMTQPWHLLLTMAVSSSGVGLAYAALPILVLDVTLPERSGAAVGVNTLMRSVGTTAAGAVMAALLLAGTDGLVSGQVAPAAWAFRLAFGVGALGALAGALVALTAPRMSSSMGPEPVALSTGTRGGR